MSWQPTFKVKEASIAVPIQPRISEMLSSMQSHIAAKAYQLYERNGYKNGKDKADWLEAEAQIVTTVHEIQDSGTSYTITVPMKGTSSDEIQVCLEPYQAVILVEKECVHSKELNPMPGSELSKMFTVVNWPDEVDVFAASAFSERIDSRSP